MEENYASLFVMLCGAHSIDLLLEDFYKKNTWVKETVDSVKQLVTFIRNHHKPLALFRKVSKLELLKPGDTRFGTNFIMLERALAVHAELEVLVASRDWKKWVKRQKKASKKQAAATIKATVHKDTVWTQAKALVKASKPFVITMKMCDGDVPAMGKVYKRMFDASEKLKSIPNNELPAARRNAMVAQAEERWLYFDHPLHRAAYALDPEFQQHDWHTDPDVTNALEDVLERYYGGDTESLAAAERQIEEYRTRQGRFARAACVANMEQMSGWSWWAKYGGGIPELQRVAMDVLSLVAGSWSDFDFIHTKKRNKLSAAKCAESVYIFSNLRLLLKVTAGDAKEAFYKWQEHASQNPILIRASEPATNQVNANQLGGDSSLSNSSTSGSELGSDEISDSN